MTTTDIVARLLALPAEIAAAEESVLQAHARLLEAKDMLQQKEDGLLLGNMIDGKNEAIRSAQMRQFTEHERAILADAELNLKNANTRLSKVRDEFRALNSVASLIAAREVA